MSVFNSVYHHLLGVYFFLFHPILLILHALPFIKKICAYTLNQSHSRTLKNLCCHHILSPQFSILHQLSAFRQRMCNEPYQKSRSCKTLLKNTNVQTRSFLPCTFSGLYNISKTFSGKEFAVTLNNVKAFQVKCNGHSRFFLSSIGPLFLSK